MTPYSFCANCELLGNCGRTSLADIGIQMQSNRFYISGLTSGLLQEIHLMESRRNRACSSYRSKSVYKNQQEENKFNGVDEMNNENSKQYASRDAWELDKEGNYYTRHVMAMTREGLHSKGDIAAELGFRDQQIDKLKARIAELESDK